MHALTRYYPDLHCEQRLIRTSGDQDRGTALWHLTERGFFTSQLEQALIDKQADIAVHSFKDLPTVSRPGLVIAAVCDRRFPEDVLVAGTGEVSIETLPEGARIGTSSLRRAALCFYYRPDVHIVPMRGNVGTRLEKLDNGGVDALILARAGLERLGLAQRISACLDPLRFIPAAAQGALAVQVRADRPEIWDMVARIDHTEGRITSDTERHVLSVLECGCHAPAGVYAHIQGQRLQVSAFVSRPDGTDMQRLTQEGPVAQAQEVGSTLAQRLLDAGARDILADLEDQRKRNHA
jgi:hydroxymethylbilane synthase